MQKTHIFEWIAAMLGTVLLATSAIGQQTPPVPEKTWQVPGDWRPEKIAPPRAAYVPDSGKLYTLAELIDIAERNNPETRVAWENARARANDLGIAKASLYPTVAAIALADTSRVDIFFSPEWIRQTSGTFSPTLSLDYLIFDFGRREAAIDTSRSNLLAANFGFNDTHRRIIFAVMQAYYHLLYAQGQQEAADATLRNAETDREAAEARLDQGLATLPDVLEARSAAAQADYDLQAAIGAAEIAHGDLADALGVSPMAQFQVQSIRDLTIPIGIDDTVEASIDRALAQRPDLMQQVAALRAAKSEIKSAQRAYTPTLRFGGDAGLSRTYAEQKPGIGLYSPNQETWDARLTLSWDLFDGFARENRLARAHHDERQAKAQVDATRDHIENQVWAAYSTARTALREQKAAAALLASANESYNAAIESYNYGVRTQIDVVSAQRTLAAARTADITARTQLLTGIAALAFQTGDLLHGKTP